MPTTGQRDTIEAAVIALQAAEAELLQAGFACSDTLELGRINAQYAFLDSLLRQLVHTRLIQDDAVFAQATATIKVAASHLDEQAASIDKVVLVVERAAKIAGDLTKAATLVAGL